MRFFLFTKTKWNEPPRLRHQFAELLVKHGHEVIFFEKPAIVGFSLFKRKTKSPYPKMQLRQHSHLLHHKLRVFVFLHHLNNLCLISSIKENAGPIYDDDVVINFNYDYYFLRKIFPSQKIITVINDDFISVAYSKSAAEWALKKSCDISNTILTVSVPLQNSLSRFGKTELFLPWTSGEYVTPSLDVDSKNLILFWGYINFRLDYDRINRMIDEVYRTNPEMKFLFVGPIGHSTRGDNTEKLDDVIANLREKKNVEFRPPSKLSDIEVDKVLAAIIPYRPNDPEIDAITISNKTFQLLSKGLPILISDLPAMPNFVNQEFVFRINPENVSDVVGKVKAGFGELQPAISKYVNENTSQMRMEQLVRYL